MSLSGIAGCSGFSAKAVLDDYSGDELIPVIVSLRGDAVMAAPAASGKDTGFLESDEAAQITDDLLSAQEKVQQEIRRFYPELEVGYRYSVLVNGFSCMLPESLIDDAEELPQVESVTEVQSCAVALMNNTPEYCGIPTYTETTGCTGEGQVIALIDTELDISHPMFAALDDDKDVKLTREDVDNIVRNTGLSIDIDPEKAYISSKLPYVIDYISDPYEGYMDHIRHGYHGTHVAGIAAGNEVTDSNGMTVSGVAKDAQLIFMSASDGMVFSVDTVMAAIEDAVKLKADVINISIGISGDSFSSEMYSRAIDIAEKAGVTICVGAGNNGDGGLTYTPDSPDRAYMNDMTSFSNGAMAVASADAPTKIVKPAFSHGDELICHDLSVSSPDNAYVNISEVLSGNTYEYVYCGLGTDEDMQDKDLTGKIALFDRGDLTFDEKEQKAEAAGAVGVIIINTASQQPLNIPCREVPAALISYEDGQKLLSSDDKTISFAGATSAVLTPSVVSSFSSWGVPSTLELRPDIMGFGGNIWSAYYDGQYAYNSGTSMATPYISGCAALISDHMKRSGIELSGPEKTRYIRNLLMSSAVPYIENDMYVTPRRQGAGLVSMENALSDKVLIRGANGESKVSLHDGITDEFSFDVELENISDEDVDFNSASLALTTDGIIIDEMTGGYKINGQAPLAANADLTGLLHIGAGEKITVNVTVSLDPEQNSQLSEVFVNGFFVDGFILLEGAENCCDISIPMVGFHGDWTELPIINNVIPCVKNGNSSLYGGYSISAIAEIAGDIIEKIPSEMRSGLYGNSDELLMNFIDQDTLLKLKSLMGQDIFVSPDNDGLADQLGLFISDKRYCSLDGIDVYSENGELVYEGEKDKMIPNKDGASISLIEAGHNISSLPDGKYIGVVDAKVNYGDETQQIAREFVIDTVNPELSTSISEKDGRRILTVRASDDNLDGIIISGKGKGGIAGEYDPSADIQPIGLLARMNTASRLINSEMQFSAADYSSNELPTVGRCFSGMISAAEAENISFSDVITASPDNNGVLSVEYDITDLENAEVTAIDKALNMTASGAETVSAGSVANGVWSCDNGYFIVSDKTTYMQERSTGEKSEFFIKADTEKTVLLDANGKFAADIEAITDRSAVLKWFDGKTEKLHYLSDDEDFSIYSTKEIENAVKAHMRAYYYVKTSKIKTSADSHGSLTVSVWTNNVGNEYLFGSYIIDERTGSGKDPSGFNVELFGEPFAGFGKGVWLNVLPDGQQRYFAFSSDGKSGEIINLFNGSRIPFTCIYSNNGIIICIQNNELRYSVSKADDGNSYVLSTMNINQGTMTMLYDKEPAEFTFYPEMQLGNMAMTYEEAVYGEAVQPENISALPDGSAMINMQNGHVYIIDRVSGSGIDGNGNPVDLSDIPYVPDEGCFTAEDLSDMAISDYVFKTGKMPADAKVSRNIDGTASVTMTDAEGAVMERYDIDPETGKGSDSQGNDIDLPQTGNNSLGMAASAGAAAMLASIGVYAAIRSGIIRRKEENE